MLTFVGCHPWELGCVSQGVLTGLILTREQGRDSLSTPKPTLREENEAFPLAGRELWPPNSCSCI